MDELKTLYLHMYEIFFKLDSQFASYMFKQMLMEDDDNFFSNFFKEFSSLKEKTRFSYKVFVIPAVKCENLLVVTFQYYDEKPQEIDDSGWITIHRQKQI
jgi:hypothetical protein